MADQDKTYPDRRGDLPGGAMNSEHEAETSNMETPEGAEGKEPPSWKADPSDGPAGTVEHTDVQLPRATSKTATEKQAEERVEGGFGMRPKHQMSQHETLSREGDEGAADEDDAKG